MKICSLLQGMLWNGVENGMEWKDDFGMECGRCSEWNGMEDLKNGMEDGLSYFHINYIKYSIFKLTTNYKVMPKIPVLHTRTSSISGNITVYPHIVKANNRTSSCCA